MGKKDSKIYEKEPENNFLNKHYLYRAIKKFLWVQFENPDEIEPNFFMLDQAINGLSVDWSKYIKPKYTLIWIKEKRGLPKKSLEEYGIVEINIGDLRLCIINNEFNLKIEHNPLPENRAHTLLKDIVRDNVAKIREELCEITNWVKNLKPRN